ncbi:non-canonical purine NTP pyrophosphatase [bacterium]|nr:MAG: non-canonical purine NTP pyrophosphatase [bacterium]
MKNKELTFITGNVDKAKYLADYFHMTIAHKKIDLPEIQSLELREVVEDKAQRAFAEVGKPVLVEDVSVTFEAMNNLPGPFIKWFEKSLGNEGVCRLLDGKSNRNATAEVMFGYCDGNEVQVFSGMVKGRIATEPRGEGGFGWDKIFINEGFEKTRAEMSEEEWHEFGMRKIALEKLATFLDTLPV